MPHQNISIAVDDFGINPQTNEAILRLVRAGQVDRVAIMTNGILRPDEIAALLDSGVALDVHLDIDDDLREKRLNGFFERVFRFIREYFIGNYRADSVAAIWEKQLLDFQRLFHRLPDGLNTHQHVHFFPPLFSVFLSLAEKYHIRYVRLGKQSSGLFTSVAFALDCFRRLNHRRLKRSGIDTSDYLISADWIPGLDVAAYADRRFPENICIEAIYHPELPEEFAFLARGR